MSTYTQILYLLVFSTRKSKAVMREQDREPLRHFVAECLASHNCPHHHIVADESQLRILFQLHPSESLSALVKELKVRSHFFIRDQNLFPDFRGWEEGYSAFSYSLQSKEKLIEFVTDPAVYGGQLPVEPEHPPRIAAEEKAKWPDLPAAPNMKI